MLEPEGLLPAELAAQALGHSRGDRSAGAWVREGLGSTRPGLRRLLALPCITFGQDFARHSRMSQRFSVYWLRQSSAQARQHERTPVC